jgi:hypothetical protein
MSSIKVKNLDIKFSDYMTREQVKEAIDRGFAGVDLANGKPVYLVKIWIGNMKKDQAFQVVRDIRDAFKAMGIENCMFVPLHEEGIQDIEVIEVPNEKV